MPIYEFRCLRCSHIFELLSLKKDDLVEVKCPECAFSEVERVISRANVSVASGASSTSKGPAVTSRSCSSGTCTTIDLPGHVKK